MTFLLSFKPHIQNIATCVRETVKTILKATKTTSCNRLLNISMRINRYATQIRNLAVKYIPDNDYNKLDKSYHAQNPGTMGNKKTSCITNFLSFLQRPNKDMETAEHKILNNTFVLAWRTLTNT